MKGEISKWFDEKGYGFVAGDDGKTYFLHIKQIKNKEAPNVGDSIKFEVVNTQRGEQAHNAVIVSKSYQ